MTTVQQAIQAKSTEIAATLKFKGSDAQQAYATSIAQYHLAGAAMMAVSRGDDMGACFKERVAEWTKNFKIRGGLNASEFISQKKPTGLQAKDEQAVDRLRLSFGSRMSAEILDAEFKG
jgi:hypothetical protein